MSIVIDTNVVISALLFGGVPGKIATCWKKGEIEPVFSRDILDEYLKVLTYPKFSLTEPEIEFLLNHELLPYFGTVTVPNQKLSTIVEADPDDDKFILCALADSSEFIISGDKHLLELVTYQGIRIITPSVFLNI
ncbi:putative toxin-antitoxin system toxin component, PIN family [bacterium]|nr:putative toxin-antitoxin system toxin component, PIN family [bacterium]